MKYLLFSTVLALILPAVAAGHGVEVSDITGQRSVRTVRFGYTDGSPMLFAKVKVYSPSRPDVTVQESIADLNGYFSLIPFENGDWRLTAEDGMGHKGEIFITVAEDTAPGTAETARASASAGTLPMYIAIVLGLSLICNVFAFWYLRGKKLKKVGADYAHK